MKEPGVSMLESTSCDLFCSLVLPGSQVCITAMDKRIATRRDLACLHSTDYRLGKLCFCPDKLLPFPGNPEPIELCASAK